MQLLRKYISTITELSDESWEVLMECATEMEFKRNELVLREGQICNAIYFINRGLCKACYNKDGREVNTSFYFENDFVTNLKSLRTGARSEYMIKCCEKTSAVRLDKNKLLEAYKISHQIETFGRRVLELMIARQEEHADSFKILTPKQRFDNLVSMRPDFLQRVSLTQTASYLGISRETLSRFRAVK